jgi:hypothetical protein
MKKLQNELDTVKSVKIELSWRPTSQNLPYLQAVTKEVFRLHPTTPLGYSSRVHGNDNSPWIQVSYQNKASFMLNVLLEIPCLSLCLICFTRWPTLRWMKLDFSTRQPPPFAYKMLVTLTKEGL